ncbi:MAG: CinA family protein [Candidatus Portiera sp.]|nr:CinA family protein [Portiera sp.]
MNKKIIESVKCLSSKLLAKNLVLLSVESCTGGGLGYYCTNQAGSSIWYAGGHITYHNSSKIILGVPATTLSDYGAVSEQTALAMAQAALRQVDGDKDKDGELTTQYCSLAITGIAGPEGGSAEKPVGTVCFSWVTNAKAKEEKRIFAGSRAAIRDQAILYSLDKMATII